MPLLAIENHERIVYLDDDVIVQGEIHLKLILTLHLYSLEDDLICQVHEIKPLHSNSHCDNELFFVYLAYRRYTRTV